MFNIICLAASASIVMRQNRKEVRFYVSMRKTKPHSSCDDHYRPRAMVMIFTEQSGDHFRPRADKWTNEQMVRRTFVE